MFFLMVLSDDGQTIIAEIYNKNYERMLYVAKHILGEHHAEDAVHGALEHLITKFDENIESLSDKPGRYYVLVVRNYSLDLLRKEHLKTVPFEDELLDNESLVSSTNNPESVAISNESLKQLTEIIRKLAPATRQVLEYRFVEGYTNIEIAEMLNVSQSVVSSRIDRAKKRLRELLESEVAENVNE